MLEKNESLVEFGSLLVFDGNGTCAGVKVGFQLGNGTLQRSQDPIVTVTGNDDLIGDGGILQENFLFHL